MTPVPQLGERVGAGAMSEVFAWDEAGPGPEAIGVTAAVARQ